jgi:hypothetical protein
MMRNRPYLTVLSILWLATLGVVEADLIQYLDATVSGNFTGNPITLWFDQSASGDHAVAKDGSV